MKFLFVFFALTFSFFGQTAESETKITDTTYVISEDDAILRMMDSLMSERYFQSFGFTLDSMHMNSDAVLPPLSDSLVEERVKSLNQKSPISLDYNEHVLAFIKLYVERKRELLSKVISLMPSYYPLFEEVLDRYNMPLELKHLAVVESALSPVAKSRVGAQGLWQFMYRTGKMYGLEIDSYQDDRMDPYKATVAACEYMSDLYDKYGDWHLVLAAYNSGPGNVNKAIRRSGGKRNYWEIRRFLPRETRSYVPAFIAVNYAINHYQDHMISPAFIHESHSYQRDTIKLYRSLSFDQISAYVDISVDQLQFLNPTYKLDYIPYRQSGQILCLPVEKVGLFLANEEAIYADIRRNEIADSIAGKEKEELAPQVLVHVVRSGEFLGSIANKYNCRVSDLMSWNNKRSTRLNPGDRLNIYTDKPPKPTQAKKPEKSATPIQNGKYQVHIVRSGDTLWDIAKEYSDTSVNDLKRLNSNLNFKRLKPGMQVKVKQIS